jgi:predicted transcriptional regulator
LTRLVADGLLVRHGRRRHYVYTCEPSVEVARSTAQQAARDLMVATTGRGLVHFVDALDQGSPELARQLERLLAERHARDGRP